jgi:hypothetical protein
MDPLTFDELRTFLHESTQGRVFDSLICVEIGLDEYNAAWDAHVDMSEADDFHDVIVAFLSDVADYIGVSDCDFEKATVEAPKGA